jgi:hypothetical protein
MAGELARATKQLALFAALDFVAPVPPEGLTHYIKEIARIHQALYAVCCYW